MVGIPVGSDGSGSDGSGSDGSGSDGSGSDGSGSDGSGLLLSIPVSYTHLTLPTKA